MHTERIPHILCSFCVPWVVFALFSADYMHNIEPLVPAFGTLSKEGQQAVLFGVRAYSAVVYTSLMTLAIIAALVCVFSHQHSAMAADCFFYGLLAGCVTVYTFLWAHLHAALPQYYDSHPAASIVAVVFGLWMMGRQTRLIRRKG